MWTNVDKRDISEIPFDKILIDKSILILNVCAYDCSSEGRLVVYHCDIEINNKDFKNCANVCCFSLDKSINLFYYLI